MLLYLKKAKASGVRLSHGQNAKATRTPGCQYGCRLQQLGDCITSSGIYDGHRRAMKNLRIAYKEASLPIWTNPNLSKTTILVGTPCT
jgi:hypothetical protein